MKSRGGNGMSTLSGAWNGDEHVTQFAGDPTPSSQAAEDVPVVAYMTAGGTLFARAGNRVVRQIPDESLLVSDVTAHYGPLVELVARPDWRPAPAEVVGYLDVYRNFWKAAPYGGCLMSGSEEVSRYEIEQDYGPLTPLGPISTDPQDKQVAGPDPLGMFGFEGKWMECSRRSKAGPWCEWRTNTSLLSLGVLVTVAREHAAEAHDG